jgi:hypothetical protein
VWIYFNEVIGHTNYLTPFTFRVRKASAGLPGALIWESSTMYADSTKGLNQFLYYEFEQGNFINEPFFIGFHQTTSDYINVGLDLNTVSTNKMFYKTVNGWANSAVQGSVMLHPVFGKKVKPAEGLGELESMKVALYPNPADTYFTIESDVAFNLSILDMQGKEVYSQSTPHGKNTISVDFLPKGIYLLRTVSATSQEIQFQKLVVQ